MIGFKMQIKHQWDTNSLILDERRNISKFLTFHKSLMTYGDPEKETLWSLRIFYIKSNSWNS